MLHNLLPIEPLAEQFPNPRSGLVELENTARRNINENRGLVQALGDNLWIGAQYMIESKFAQLIISKKLHRNEGAAKNNVSRSICSEQTSTVSSKLQPSGNENNPSRLGIIILLRLGIEYVQHADLKL